MATAAKYLPTEEGSAKAWAHWEGSDATIDDDYNVASLTDNGVGDFTVNIANDMANANFAGVAAAVLGVAVGSNSGADCNTYVVGSVSTKQANNGSASDRDDTTIVVIGALA